VLAEYVDALGAVPGVALALADVRNASFAKFWSLGLVFRFFASSSWSLLRAVAGFFAGGGSSSAQSASLCCSAGSSASG